jgi:hypothetical protein
MTTTFPMSKKPMSPDEAFAKAGTPIQPFNNTPSDRTIKKLSQAISLLRSSESEWFAYVDELRAQLQKLQQENMGLLNANAEQRRERDRLALRDRADELDLTTQQKNKLLAE